MFQKTQVNCFIRLLTSRLTQFIIFAGIAVLIFVVYVKFGAESLNLIPFELPEGPEKKCQEVDAMIVKKYQEQSTKRAEYLKNQLKAEGIGVLYNALVPEVFCKDLIRIGMVGDGGKWICNPNKMLALPKCSIYSLGTNNDPSFEEDLQQFLNNKCILRSVDKDDQNPETNERIKNANGSFRKAFIGSPASNQTSFRKILSEFNDDRIDILKIDIEGGEFLIIDELISVPMCQILIEIHGKTAEQTLELLQTFSKNGFYLFSYEINGFHPELSEYSFIHASCFDIFGIETVYGKFLS